MTRILLLLALGVAGCRPVPASAPEAAAPVPAPAGSVATENAAYIAAVRQRIAGREAEPAGQVFENVQYLQNTRADVLLRIMDLGFSQGLGVTCTHCHDPQNFASDTLRPKRAAREMQAMLRGINDRLRTLQNTQHTVPAISCSTCHRGSAIPRPFEAR